MSYDKDKIQISYFYTNVSKNKKTDPEQKRSHLTIGWRCQGYGFGQLIFVADNPKEYTSENYFCDTEHMGKEFAKDVLDKFLDMFKFDTDE